MTTAPAGPKQPEVAERAGQLRVLVVDYNEDSGDSLATLVRMWGHDVHVSRDGAEALEDASDYRPDVVLTELVLPKISGCELARRLRERAPTRALNLIAVTGRGDPPSRRLAQEAGFCRHMLKPANLDELQYVLAVFLEKKTHAAKER
jgi:CheY-like chemotaxis protein